MENAQWMIMQPHAFICSLTSTWTCWPTASRRGWCLLGCWWCHRYASCGTACRWSPAWCPASCRELPALGPWNAASARPGTHLGTTQDTVTAKKQNKLCIYPSSSDSNSKLLWFYNEILLQTVVTAKPLKNVSVKREKHAPCLWLTRFVWFTSFFWSGWTLERKHLTQQSQICLFLSGSLQKPAEAERFVYLVVLASEGFSAAGI